MRLTGCNLRCTWCDTEYAFYGGKKMSLDEIMEAVHTFSDRDGKRMVHLVELTGGEPLLQKDIYPLIDRLLEAGYRVDRYDLAARTVTFRHSR